MQARDEGMSAPLCPVSMTGVPTRGGNLQGQRYDRPSYLRLSDLFTTCQQPDVGHG